MIPPKIWCSSVSPGTETARMYGMREHQYGDYDPDDGPFYVLKADYDALAATAEVRLDALIDDLGEVVGCQ
jgi:hypothetical protein